ncbi:MAG: flippase-like domain-containing protein [Synergistaceae bacterium]|nr:flippase-like domain-containing protein [Synergistaceae bacterium]
MTVSVVCLFYALRGINIASLRDEFREYSVPGVAVVLLAFACCVWIQALRLSALFSPKLGSVNALEAILVGLGFNNVLPAKGGEAVKVAYISKFLGRHVSDAASAVLMERFWDANGLFVLSAVILGDILDPSARQWGGVFFVVFWALFIFFRARHDIFLKIWNLLPLVGRVRFLDELRESLLRRTTSRQILEAGALTVGSWAAYFAYSACAFIIAGNFPITIGDAAVIFLISAAGQLVPSSPGSLGVFEASVVWGSGIFGVDREQALGIAFLLRVIQSLPTVSAVALFMVKRT